MILIPDDIFSRITILTGLPDRISNTPTEIFESTRLSFFADLSRVLMADPIAMKLPDVMSFAYWCRQSNLIRSAKLYQQENKLRLGLGLSFHICPANVPVNFAFSIAFGLLSGNTCVARLPTNESETVNVLIRAINQLLQEKDYSELQKSLMLMRFSHNEDVSRFWISVADGRIIWGGDSTVNLMRSFTSKARSRDIVFPDRYSLCALSAKAVLQADKNQLKKLCENLFNDIYLMDQAACSSPQLLIWIGSKIEVKNAKEKLWPEFLKIVRERYHPKSIQIVDKYVQSCRNAIENTNISFVNCDDNLLYRVELDGLSAHQDQCRGYFGTIHEISLKKIDLLKDVVNEKYQTLTYFGLSKDNVAGVIKKMGFRGIDRIVPVGRALDMGFIWDGYDMINSFSRVISVE